MKITFMLCLMSSMMAAQSPLTKKHPLRAFDVIVQAPLQQLNLRTSKSADGIVIGTAVNEWITKSTEMKQPELIAARSQLIALLMGSRDSFLKAFAFSYLFRQEDTQSATTQDNAEALALAVVFAMPNAKDVGVVTEATIDNGMDAARGQSMYLAMYLRKALGFPAITGTLHEQFGTFPMDRESTCIWVLNLLRSTPAGLAIADKVAKELEALQQVPEGSFVKLRHTQGMAIPQISEVFPTNSAVLVKPAPLTLWLIPAIVILGAFGLLWLVLKKRK